MKYELLRRILAPTPLEKAQDIMDKLSPESLQEAVVRLTLKDLEKLFNFEEYVDKEWNFHRRVSVK